MIICIDPRAPNHSPGSIRTSLPIFELGNHPSLYPGRYFGAPRYVAPVGIHIPSSHWPAHGRNHRSRRPDHPPGHSLGTLVSSLSCRVPPGYPPTPPHWPGVSRGCRQPHFRLGTRSRSQSIRYIDFWFNSISLFPTLLPAATWWWRVPLLLDGYPQPPRFRFDEQSRSHPIRYVDF